MLSRHNLGGSVPTQDSSAPERGGPAEPTPMPPAEDTYPSSNRYKTGSEPTVFFSNMGGPTLSRRNSFDSARVSGPFHHVPFYAPPFQEGGTVRPSHSAPNLQQPIYATGYPPAHKSEGDLSYLLARPPLSQNSTSSHYLTRPISWQGAPPAGGFDCTAPRPHVISSATAMPPYPHPHIVGAETSSIPPPVQPPFLALRSTPRLPERQVSRETDSASFSYPPRPASVPATLNERITVPQDRSPTNSPRPLTTNPGPLPSVGAAFGMNPDLDYVDYLDMQEKPWWENLKSFFLVALIIIFLPILYPLNCVLKYFRSMVFDFSEPHSLFDRPTYMDLAITYVSGVPRTIYHNMLFRLPGYHFSRVAQVFEEANLSLNELKTMALETASRTRNTNIIQSDMIKNQSLPPAYENLKHSWDAFIDSLLEEWKTLNLVSILLLSAILTILTIDAASADPYTRYFALSSLVCALLSLLYGCLYIIHFSGTMMRKTYRLVEWALEARKIRTPIIWNVWVLLAMPAVYLVWSLLLFICCIMSFIWRIGVDNNGVNATPPSPGLPSPYLSAHNVMRGVVSGILALGCIFGVLVASTFQRYGRRMDRAWKARIDGWIAEKATNYAEATEQDYLGAYGQHSQSFHPPMTMMMQENGREGGPYYYGTQESPPPASVPPLGPVQGSELGHATQWQPPMRDVEEGLGSSARKESHTWTHAEANDGAQHSQITTGIALAAAGVTRSAQDGGQGEPRDRPRGEQISRSTSPESVSVHVPPDIGHTTGQRIILVEEPPTSISPRPVPADHTPSPLRSKRRTRSRTRSSGGQSTKGSDDAAVQQSVKDDGGGDVGHRIDKEMPSSGNTQPMLPPTQKRVPAPNSDTGHSKHHIGGSTTPLEDTRAAPLSSQSVSSPYPSPFSPSFDPGVPPSPTQFSISDTAARIPVTPPTQCAFPAVREPPGLSPPSSSSSVPPFSPFLPPRDEQQILLSPSLEPEPHIWAKDDRKHPASDGREGIRPARIMDSHEPHLRIGYVLGDWDDCCNMEDSRPTMRVCTNNK